MTHNPPAEKATAAASPEAAEAVRIVVTRLAHHIDARAWSELAALFAEEVETDYTSLFGGELQRQGGAELVSGWRTALGNVATQHLLGPIEVSVAGRTAHAACHVRAFHHHPGAAGGPEWEVLGHYRVALAGEGTQWKITRLVLDTLVQTGNRNLLSDAAADEK